MQENAAALRHRAHVLNQVREVHADGATVYRQEDVVPPQPATTVPVPAAVLPVVVVLLLPPGALLADDGYPATTRGAPHDAYPPVDVQFRKA